MVRIDAASRRVVVGPREALRRDTCRVGAVVWQQRATDGPVAVQLRHHHRAEPARLEPDGHGGLTVRFEQPSAAVTPGQYAAFYDGDLVLGAGRVLREA